MSHILARLRRYCAGWGGGVMGWCKRLQTVTWASDIVLLAVMTIGGGLCGKIICDFCGKLCYDANVKSIYAIATLLRATMKLIESGNHDSHVS